MIANESNVYHHSMVRRMQKLKFEPEVKTKNDSCVWN